MTTTSPDFNETAKKPSYKSYVYVTSSNDETVGIKLHNATIDVPHDSTRLIKDVTLTLPKGAKAVLVGPNGSGKTSLFRVARGLWDAGDGTIELHSTFNDQTTLCASQEIRKVPTTLPGIMAYAKPPSSYTHAEYEAALDKVGLSQIKNHLPWNAVDADNILERAKPYLDMYTDDITGRVTAESAAQVLKGFRAKLEKKLELPSSLDDYMNEERRENIIDALTDYVANKIGTEPHKGYRPLVFPSRAGRKIGARVAESTKYAVDGWLLHGQRMRLSGGQQQMLAFARKFLQKPEFMLIDEGTSDLKQDKAQELLSMLFREMPDSTVLAIVHDDTLIPLFTHVIELNPDKQTLTIRKTTDRGPRKIPGPEEFFF